MKGKFGVIGILDGWKKGDLPDNQMVNIVLNSYATLVDGSIALTCQLATDDEVDYAVNQLISDLELVRRMAKANIHQTNRKIQGS